MRFIGAVMMGSDRLSDWYAGRTVVVTGAYGYLGTGLCNRLRAAGANLRRGTRAFPGRANDPEVWRGALCDPVFCDELVAGADVIFHMSGQTSIKDSHNDPVGDLQANVQSTLTLLKACAQTNRVPSFVYSGTATEIGLTTKLPIQQGAMDRPITVYDANKLAAEQLVGVYTENNSVRGVTLRIANVYGPGAKKSAADRGVTNKMVLRAMARQDLTYYGDGNLVRDYVYVDDLLDAFVRAGALADRAKSRSYVVAGGEGYTLRGAFELIADVVAEMGHGRVRVLSAPWPDHLHPIDRRSYVADIAPIAEFCGWRPTVSLRHGIRLTAEAFLRESSTTVVDNR